jgi:hypothetical protein
MTGFIDEQGVGQIHIQKSPAFVDVGLIETSHLKAQQ